MDTTIIVALISAASAIFVGALTLIGVIVTNNQSNKEVQKKIEASQAEFQKKIEIAQAVTDTKIEELTREVREHNNFAKRMPKVETEIEHIESDIKDLKKYHIGG